MLALLFSPEHPYTSVPLLVTALVLVLSLYRLYTTRCETLEDEALAKFHGCKPPPRLQNRRPLGIDRLVQIFKANAESRLMRFFFEHCKEIGWTMEQCFLGNVAYGTADPANVEAIMSSNFKDWGMGVRRGIMFPLFGEGIFVQEGESWKHSREMLRPQFHHREYADLSIFEGTVDDLLANIEGGGIVDLQPLFFRLTLDTTTAFLFGESVHSLRNSGASGEETFEAAFNLAQDYIAKRFRLLDIYWVIGGPKFRDACRKVHAFADQIIAQNLVASSKEENKGNYVFLRSVAEKTTDREALRGQIINILIAGRDTTACLLTWTFFQLVRHPHVLTKLKTEIELTCKENDKLDRDVLRGMNYLQNVLKEILRLYPSVPVNTRTALKTTVLPAGGGPDGRSPVLIRKGAAVIFGLYTMHRRPDLYGNDSELFRPERWDEDLPLNRDPTSTRWAYLPFHGGPRVCLGMDFALTEAAYTLVRILQRFPNINLPKGVKVEPVGHEKQTMTLVLSSAEGCVVNLG